MDPSGKQGLYARKATDLVQHDLAPGHPSMEEKAKRYSHSACNGYSASLKSHKAKRLQIWPSAWCG